MVNPTDNFTKLFLYGHHGGNVFGNLGNVGQQVVLIVTLGSMTY
jgi:hypothetical protein